MTTEVPHSRRWRPTLWAVVATAFFVRLWNLGTFSPWLDEFVTLRFARLPFSRLLRACAGDAENVPLYAIVTHLGTRTGLADPWIRMPFILFGTAGIAALMLWVRKRLGPTAALAAGVMAALAPFHVRYSQEMRAYPLLQENPPPVRIFLQVEFSQKLLGLSDLSCQPKRTIRIFSVLSSG